MSYPFNAANTQLWDMSTLSEIPSASTPIAYAWARMMNNHNVRVGPPISDEFTGNDDGLVHQLFQYGEAIHDNNVTNNPNLNTTFYCHGEPIGTESGL